MCVLRKARDKDKKKSPNRQAIRGKSYCRVLRFIVIRGLEVGCFVFPVRLLTKRLCFLITKITKKWVP